MKTETIEERKPYWNLVDAKAEQNNIIDLDAYAKGVQDGVNWQKEQIYEDMQEYAKFCIHCDRVGLKPIIAEDWFKQFKNKL